MSNKNWRPAICAKYGKFVEHCAQMAYSIAENADCNREGGKVGCVIGRSAPYGVLAVGASQPILLHTPNGVECDGVSDPCGCIHAEAKAIALLEAGVDMHGQCSRRLFMAITRAPCLKCAQLIVGTAVIGFVVCPEPEKQEKGMDLLTKAGVQVYSHIGISENSAVIGEQLLRRITGEK